MMASNRLRNSYAGVRQATTYGAMAKPKEGTVPSEAHGAAYVPEAKIGAITALASSPGFWSVFFAPMLDVRFSRRWYATVLAAWSGTAAAAAVLCLHYVLMLQIALVVGVAAAGLSSSALNGWLSNIPPNEHKTRLASG